MHVTVRDGLSRPAHGTDFVAARVENQIPRSISDGVERNVAIADDVLDIRKRPRIGKTTMKDRYRMAFCKTGFDNVPSHEPGSAEHQRFHLPVVTTPVARGTCRTKKKFFRMSILLDGLRADLAAKASNCAKGSRSGAYAA
jgi:hypothetical protein